nr:hypothetical protein [Tanacetum cinerariifolium]
CVWLKVVSELMVTVGSLEVIVILFGTIPTTIPDTTPVITPPTTQTDTTVIPIETPIIAPIIQPSPDYTPTSPDYSHASETESDPSEDPSSGHIPPLPAVSPFLSSDDDTTDSDTPDTPPSPTHGTPFTEITASTQRSPVIPRRRVMILAPGHPIPHGRPYRYHPNGPVHMMTVNKRVGPLPVQQLAVRHSVDHSSSDSSSRCRSKKKDYSSRHSFSDHSSLDLPSTSAGPSRKRHVEVGPRETSLRDYVISRYALRDRGIDASVVVEAVDRDEIETGVRSLVKVRVERIAHLVMPEDIPEPTQEGAVIESVQMEQGHRIVEVESTVAALTERVAELERDNRRLRGTASVESQRVDRIQRDMSRMQRETRQMRRF